MIIFAVDMCPGVISLVPKRMLFLLNILAKKNIHLPRIRFEN